MSSTSSSSSSSQMEAIFVLEAKVLELRTNLPTGRELFFAICSIVAMFHTFCESFDPRNNNIAFVFETLHFPCQVAKRHNLSSKLSAFSQCWSSLLCFDYKKARGSGNSIVNKHYNQLTRKFNEIWNVVRNAISTSTCDNELVLFFRDCIGRIPFLETTSFVKENPCIVFKDNVEPLQQRVPREHVKDVKRKNYDGLVPGKSVKQGKVYEFTTRKSCDSGRNPKTQGLYFGFDSREEFLSCIFNAINDARPQQIQYCRNSEIPNCLKVPYHDRTIKYGGMGHLGLVLHIRHEHGFGVINYDSFSIINLLLQKPVPKHRLDGHVNSTMHGDMYNTYYLRKYAEMISTFIRQNVDHTALGITRSTCFRPDCLHDFLSTSYKEGGKKEITCPRCRKCEICLVCNKAGHGNYACDNPDEATSQEIAATSKQCPSCGVSVTKNGGCQHITCRCGTHFCWSCMTIYERNEINDHRCDRVTGVYEH